MLEEKIRDHQKKDPKFSFLTDGDAYNRYYRYMVERIREVGEETALAGSSAAAPATGAGAGATPNGSAGPSGALTPGGGSVDVADQRRNVERMKQKMEEEAVEEPKPFEFADDLPNVTAYDLDVLRLTALFVAKRGRSFLQSLSVREGRNFQFDFLRPTHSLYGYFNRTVEMYIKIMAPPAELLLELDLGEDEERKWDVLDRARKRGEWERVKREREQQRKEEKEREAKAFAEIDWQDFAVVQTIEFTSADADPSAIELPPPTTVRAMQMLSLNEKRMAAMIVEESMDGQGQQQRDDDDQEMDVEVDDEEESEDVRERKRREAEELERARAVQAKALGKAGMKIKTDYTPGARTGRVAAMGGKVPTTVCPYCKQNIPETEITEHIRIELLDPKWKEQKQLMDQKKSQAAQLMQGADVPASLRQLASARTDLFGTAADEEARKKQEAEERAARKAKETLGWDGHISSKESTVEQYQQKQNLDLQIASIHQRNGLAANAAPTAGPQLGLAAPTPSAPASTPAGNAAFSGASISAGPSAATSAYPLPPVPNPAPYGDGMYAPQAGAPPGVHPSRLAQMAPGSPYPPPQSAGQTRPLEADSASETGSAPKRQKVAKLPGGQLYHVSDIVVRASKSPSSSSRSQLSQESDWIRMHPDPIDIIVQLPNMPEKPEWKLTGNVLTVPELPLNFLFSTLRDRIAKLVDAPLPISRMKLDYGPKTLGNSSTLASVNLEDGDTITLTIRDNRKR